MSLRKTPTADPDVPLKDRPPTSPIFGREPGVFLNMGDTSRTQLLRKIFTLVEEGQLPDTACWACDVDPEEMQELMKREPKVWRAMNRYLHKAEVALVRVVRAGGPGLRKERAALECLKLTRDKWCPKTKVDITKEFQDALDELREKLKAEDYETVVKVLLKHTA